MRILCVAVMAIQAAHQAAPKKVIKADARPSTVTIGLKAANATTPAFYQQLLQHFSFVIQPVKLPISLRLASK